MEQWEQDLRAKLDREIEPGCYNVSGGGYTAYTGKGGYIEYLVEVERAIRDWVPPQPIQDPPDLSKLTGLRQEYGKFTEEELAKIVKGFFNE